MLTIIGISGSLRKKSFNTALLRNASEIMPQGSELILTSIAGVPLYNEDTETSSGIPATVEELKNRIADADGLILATPEYNNSMPGVLKNAIDWLSRPPSDVKKTFGGKPVGLMGASPGRFGAILGQDAWLPVLHILGTQVWGGERLRVSNAAEIFDDNGVLTDTNVKKLLAKYLAEFVEFARSAAVYREYATARSYTGVDR